VGRRPGLVAVGFHDLTKATISARWMAGREILLLSAEEPNPCFFLERTSRVVRNESFRKFAPLSGSAVIAGNRTCTSQNRPTDKWQKNMPQSRKPFLTQQSFSSSVKLIACRWPPEIFFSANFDLPKKKLSYPAVVFDGQLKTSQC
jgi:hypothetical protein